MKINISSADPSKTKVDALVIVTPLFKEKSNSWASLNRSLSKICSEADPKKDFKGKEGSVLTFPTLGKITPAWMSLVGLGESSDVAVHRRCLGKAFRQLQDRKVRSIGVVFAQDPLPNHTTILAAEEATYRFQSFAADPKSNKTPLAELFIFCKSKSSEASDSQKLAEAIRYARDLANQPPNLFTPSTLAQEAQKLAKRRGLHCEVWDEKKLKREGFGGILGVGQGSNNPPRFIRLDYRGTSSHESPYVVIGKAITFDTGGISIKPSERMDEMKFDKCGGIAVLGIMEAVAALGLPIHVIGLISSAENMPSATAYRPGDLIKTLSGKYVEVLNTDAEGRIVLADALTYAQRFKPRAIVDLATLTGACIICFGHECAAVLGNQEGLIQQLLAASRNTGEKIWQLPLWPEFQEKVKSDIAFVKNTAGREGGTITGACFLNAFVDSKIPWAHLDIAGMAWTSKEEPHRAKGATAFGVHLITDWLKSQAAK